MYTYLHTDQVIDIVNQQHLIKETLQQYIGHLLFVKKDLHPVEAGIQMDARLVIKSGMKAETLVELIAHKMIEHAVLLKFKENGLHVKAFLNNNIRMSLDRIRFEGETYSARQRMEGPVVQVKTKSGKTVGTMNDYLKETMPEPVAPPVKTEEEENVERLLFFLGETT